MARKHLDRAEIRDRLGASERTLYRLIDEGLPVEGKGEAARFPWPECRRWYDARLKAQTNGASAPTDLDDAKKRLVSAQAEQEELKLAEMRRELMTVADFRKVVNDANARVAARLKTLPQKLAPAVVGVRDVTEGLSRVQPLVDEVMDELFRADDVPEDEAT